MTSPTPLRLIPVAIALAFVVPTGATLAVDIHDHGDMLIGSTTDGGGDLFIEYEFADEPIVVTFSQTLGIFDLYDGTTPGFDAHPDEPGEGLFELDLNTTVSVVIDGIDFNTGTSHGATMKIGGTVLDEVGESAQIGTYDGSEGLHIHPTWQLTLPTGQAPTPHTITFHLTGGTYGDSPQYTATIVPEPTSALLLAAGTLGMLVRRRA